ncbi:MULTISPECIES: TlpA disulfide reductase family protein [unclassified Dietzia]|uniref:TlpA disulfide reductase family protein n=1 Tax=unclassified Dietzia TaxID=2617939 RepID=UPI0015F8D42D|nr:MULTISPECIES: TlpA disulfide reductase family protein [unclassified Dietzia]MBB1025044.1 TlpA family protein disulfide reductase [Dietzia sp. DQ12-76]MBB1027365.1 TlpA family protein disulfide reductase [Dietzia sp. DQ11-38-2]
MRHPKAALGALLLAGALVTGACATSTDAVVTGPETFEFVSPDGQLEIHYDPPSERRPVATLTGPDLLDPDRTLNVQEDFEGQVVILNLWGQWCGPCRAESDDLQRLQDEFEPQGATVFGINLRDPNRQKPVDFVEDNGITFPSIWDPSNAAVAALRGFPTSVVPATIILDKQHRVAAVYLAEITDDKLRDTVSAILAEEVEPV